MGNSYRAMAATSFDEATGQSPEERNRERQQRAEAWVRLNLPDEHPFWAANTARSLVLSRRKITPELVRKRLVFLGRNWEALDICGVCSENGDPAYTCPRCRGAA